MRVLFTLPILLLAATPAYPEDPLVVVAAARAGRIELFDSALGPLSAIGVNRQVESVTASPDGRRLYIAQESQKTPGACCGLFSLDLETRRMCLLAAPALFGTPSPDGRFLFTQGSHGVEIFDAATLSRLPTMKAADAYNLQPSPNGKWLLGIVNSPAPSLDVFDLRSRVLARRLPIPAGPATGAWAGDRFYIFSYDAPGGGQLWSVQPENTELPEARSITLPDLHGACNQPVLLMLAGAPDRLFLAEAFGYKVDRRLACPDTARDGVYMIRPSTGRVSHIAASVRVNRMAVSPDGGDLYVIHSSGPSPLSNSHLLHIDTRTNRVLHNVALQTGVWNLALARIPPALIPHSDLHPAACAR